MSTSPLLPEGTRVFLLSHLEFPKAKGPKSWVLPVIWAETQSLSTHRSWLFFSNKETLHAFLLSAPSLFGRAFWVKVEIKTREVGNRSYSWNTFAPDWKQSFPHKEGAKRFQNSSSEDSVNA